MTVSRVILPFETIARIMANEHPGLKGWVGSWRNHGPIAFWVAWRESGSNNPRQ